MLKEGPPGCPPKRGGRRYTANPGLTGALDQRLGEVITYPLSPVIGVHEEQADRSSSRLRMVEYDIDQADHSSPQMTTSNRLASGSAPSGRA